MSKKPSIITAEDNVPPHIKPHLAALKSIQTQDVELTLKLHNILKQTSSPILFIMEIIYYSWSSKIKAQPFQIKILDIFKKWFAENKCRLSISPQEKLDALHLVVYKSFTPGITFLCSLFTTPEEISHLRSLAEQYITKKMFNEAYYLIIAIGAEHDFPLKSLAFPLQFTGHDDKVKKILEKSPRLQREFCSTLDSICVRKSDVISFRVSVGIETSSKNTYIDAKWIRKKLATYMELYKIDIVDLPNFYKFRRNGAIHYLMKKWDEGEITYIPWEEMVLDVVTGCTDTQRDLFSMLASRGDVRIAFRLARLLGTKKEDWPNCLVGIPYSEPNESELISNVNPNDFLNFRLSIEDIHFVDDPSMFIQMVDDIATNYDVVGLDAEWKPCLGITPRERVALLQVAVWDDVYLIDILALCDAQPDMWEYFFEKIFMDEHILKLGFGIHQDISLLLEAISIELPDRNFPELVEMDTFFKKLKTHYPELDAQLTPCEDGATDLKGLSLACLRVLGKPLDKSEQTSNWENRPLRQTQAIYAAMDAYCLLMMFEKLFPFLKDNDLSLKKVLNSKRAPPKTAPQAAVPPPPRPVSDLKCVVDNCVGGVTKYLRHLGVDVIELRPEDDHMKAVQIAQSQKRVIVTSATLSQKMSGYVPRKMVYGADPTIPPKQQVVQILKYFNILYNEADVFTRCAICNSNEYLIVSKEELLKHWQKHVQPKLQSLQINRKNNTLFRCDLLTADGTTMNIHVQLAAFSPSVFERVKSFMVCRHCGKVYWEGSHVVRLKQNFPNWGNLEYILGHSN